MAKNTSNKPTAEDAANHEISTEENKAIPVNQALAVVGDEVSLAEVIKTIGGTASSDWDVVVDSSDGVYWPAIPGAVCHGILRSRYAVTTKFGQAFLYTVELKSACNAVTSDGEEIVRNPGESIIVLERTVLKRLTELMGREVAIVCDGKTMTKNKQSLWTYRVIAKKMTVDDAMRAMAQMQAQQSAQQLTK